MKRLIGFIVLSTIIVGCVPQASGPEDDGEGSFLDILFGPGAGDIFDNAHGVPPIGAIVPEAVGSVSVRVVSQSRVAANVLILFYVDDVEVHRTVLHITAFETTEIIGPDAAKMLMCSGLYSTGGSTPPLTLVFGDGFADGDLVEYIIPDPSTDGSGQPIPDDACPDDPDKIEPGVCGCGVPDTDSDGDGVPDCIDICSGADDRVDSDGDGVPDGCDICPAGDDAIDSDGDGVPDACDICPGGDDLLDTDGDGIPNACDSPPPPPPPPPPPGNEACCFFDGSCSDMTAAACLADEGSPQGPGTTCATTSCELPPDTEACCFPDGSCSDLPPSDCEGGDGTPQGVETNCETTSCELPPETEACCFFDGSCSDMTAAACLADEGTPQGPGTNCATTSCALPPLPEACCFSDGSCSDLMAWDCEYFEGTPQGPGTNCATTSCMPPMTEACCFANGSCSDLTTDDCFYWGGMPQGTGTDCATTSCPQPLEACCYPDGVCEDTTYDACIAEDGIPQGPGTNCLTTECPSPIGPIVYVDANAEGANDGTSWENAFAELADALVLVAGAPIPAPSGPNPAVTAGAPIEIWVAAGTYYPDPMGSDPSATFALVSNVVIYGGFTAGQANLTDRNPDPLTNNTVLSGDIGEPGDPSDNSYRIVTATGTVEPTVLDGFTITGANAPGLTGGGLLADGAVVGLMHCAFVGNRAMNGGGIASVNGSTLALSYCIIDNNTADASGGGLYNDANAGVVGILECPFTYNHATNGGGLFNANGSSLLIVACDFTNNTVDASGAGLYNDNSSAFVEACRFHYNAAGSGTGHSGGGIINVAAVDTTILDCILLANTAGDAGAGLQNSYSNVQVNNCTFERNNAYNNVGGGMSNLACTPTVIDCEFFGNMALLGGGGMSNEDAAPLVVNCLFSGNNGSILGGGGILNSLSAASPSIVNCTFVANEGYEGGGIYNREGANPLITNSILWDNTAGQVFGTAVMTYCDVQGGPSGIDGNIDANPLFVQWPSTGPDEAWGTADDNYGNMQLQASSPCIDAGNNGAFPDIIASTDFDGNPRFVDDPDVPDTGLGTAPLIDIGAFESQGL
ncbi:MAG: right-handed parallel beta-helix repeat-containing protein [Phycisphaerae bacterium]|nr:right-handed parallel beta-helix repeat-containing protein [Phycisphaerae bacterium]